MASIAVAASGRATARASAVVSMTSTASSTAAALQLAALCSSHAISACSVTGGGQHARDLVNGSGSRMASALFDTHQRSRARRGREVLENGDEGRGSGLVELSGGGAAGCHAQDTNAGGDVGGGVTDEENVGFGERGGRGGCG